MVRAAEGHLLFGNGTQIYGGAEPLAYSSSILFSASGFVNRVVFLEHPGCKLLQVSEAVVGLVTWATEGEDPGALRAPP